MKHAEKVATCLFLNGRIDKPFVILHETSNKLADAQLRKAVYEQKHR